MHRCPRCHLPLEKPPEDLQEWFRCENCNTPLRVPSKVGRILFFVSSFGVLVVCWTLEYYGLRYNPRIFRFVPESLQFLFYSLPLFLYAWLGRLIWRTKIGAPRVYDPYSSLNLSSDRRLRGR